MSDKATIKIPRNLYNRLNDVIEDTGFNSVTEFIVYVMREIISTTQLEGENEQLSGEEIKLIRKRLQALGYLDEQN